MNENSAAEGYKRAAMDLEERIRDLERKSDAMAMSQMRLMTSMQEIISINSEFAKLLAKAFDPTKQRLM